LERQIRRPSAVVFLGDGLRDLDRIDFGSVPVYRVLGNCDLFGFGLADDCREEEIFRIAGHTVLLTHGARYGVKSGLGALIAHAASENADLVLYGHTHEPRLDVIPIGTRIGDRTLTREIYLFNPGSIGQGGSFGTLTLQENNVLFSHGNLWK
jgi:putative phosphoesterase